MVRIGKIVGKGRSGLISFFLAAEPFKSFVLHLDSFVSLKA